MSNKKRRLESVEENSNSNPKKKRKLTKNEVKDNDHDDDYKMEGYNVQKKQTKLPKWTCDKIWDHQTNGGMYEMNELAQALKFFNENGFAVICNVMDEKENSEGRRLLLDDVKEINKNKTNLQNIKKLSDISNKQLPGWNSNGIRLQFGISHGKFAHFSRLRPNIKEIFAYFHECDKNELCCSFDSIAVTPNNAKHKRTLWLHADQSIYNEKNEKIAGWNFKSIQGTLYYTETNKNTVSFICSPESHIKYWNSLAQKTKTKIKHWVLINDDQGKDEEYLKMKQKIMDNSYRIHVPKNSFLLFNSKVFHQNGDALIKNNVDEMKRIASFICMAPKKYRTYKAFKNSLIYAINGSTSTHWPQFMKHHSAKHPRFSKGNCYEDMCDIKPKLNPNITENEFNKMIPSTLTNKQVKVYNSDKTERLTLETIHHLGIRDLSKFKVIDLWNLIDPTLKTLQPWMDPK